MKNHVFIHLSVRKHCTTQRFCVCAQISRCTRTSAGQKQNHGNSSKERHGSLQDFVTPRARLRIQITKSIRGHGLSLLCCVPKNVHINTATKGSSDIRNDTIFIAIVMILPVRVLLQIVVPICVFIQVLTLIVTLLQTQELVLVLQIRILMFMPSSETHTNTMAAKTNIDTSNVAG